MAGLRKEASTTIRLVRMKEHIIDVKKKCDGVASLIKGFGEDYSRAGNPVGEAPRLMHMGIIKSCVI